ISAPWVKVENEKGQVGWCFSGYLEALEKEGDNKQEIAGMTDLAKDKATAGLPGNVIIILIAAGALLLGALIFFLIRKKT
ncbi:MAG: SH3 domain-containing protein, partial [Spirochaetales bacterium]|nr:SH3 domain-containing protein [Spirochaetales bacterium]